MGWSVGYDASWNRDIGYGVPATCDHPGCGADIDRGLAYVCANQEPYGGDGCGLFFCEQHKAKWSDRIGAFCCERCAAEADPFDPTSDVPQWIRHKLTDASWQRWREENAAEVDKLRSQLSESAPPSGE